MGKITIEKKTASRIDKAVKLVMGKNNSLPILDNVLVSDGQITVSDLEVEIKIKTDIPGNFCVDAKQFCKIITNMPEFDVTVNNNQVVYSNIDVKGKTESFKQKGYDVYEFPKDVTKMYGTLYEHEVGVLAKEDIHKFKTSLNYLGADDLRPVMTGTYLEGGEIAATDAHKMYFDKLTIISEYAMLMPRKFVKTMCDLYSEEDPFTISVLYTEVKKEDESYSDFVNRASHFIKVESKEFVITCRGIDGKFPNYKAIIPQDNINGVEINKKDFVALLPKLYIAVNKSTNKVGLKYSGGVVKIFTEDLDFNNAYEKEIECKVNINTDSYEILFNIKVLEQIVKDCEGETFKISLSDLPSRVFVVDGKFLQMPLMK
jgi:DNA polymerase III subunit beta